jgi:Holliday junction resolvase-like predicted endonuclease
MATAKKTTEKKSATKKPAAKKAASKPAATKTKATVAVKAKPVKKVSKTSSAKIGPAERYKMVETAAYFIAERNNFAGSSADYWIAAEVQIKKMLGK